MEFEIKAKQLFIKNTKYKNSNILKIEQLISSGYTNSNYKITTKDKKTFVVKLSKKQNWAFTNESIVIKKYNKSNIIYADSQGNIIKKWIDGELFNLDRNVGNRINLLFNEIFKINKLDLKNKIPIFNYSLYVDFLAKKRKYIDLYNKILLKFKNDKMVVTHGDLNNKNILLLSKSRKDKIEFIDFEWSCYNFWWFDPVGYLCEEQILDETILTIFMKKMKLNNLKELYELMFVRWYYCYGWSYIERNNLEGLRPYVKLSKKFIKLIYKKIMKFKD